MRRTFFTALLLAMSLTGGAFANEANTGQIYQFPAIKPIYTVFMGYRVVSLSGSARASEYDYLSSSVSLGGVIRALPFPHRIYLEVDFINKKDYFADLSYAYKDTILFRWVNKTLFHNLDNITLVDLGPDPRYTVSPPDPFGDYGVTTGMNKFSLRYKTHDFPLHVYLNGMLINKNGDKQQRFLGGSGYFDRLSRQTAKREIDSQTKDITVGINSHLGPLEVDFSHTETRFTFDGNSVLYYDYSAAGGRPAGIYAHNVVPDFSGSATTVKIHTSHTGKISAAATVSKQDRENKYSGVDTDGLLGGAELKWMPLTRLTFFFKYRHREVDSDGLSSVSISSLSNPAIVTSYAVKEALSYKTDDVRGVMRYRPFKKVTIKAVMAHSTKDRFKADTWGLPDTTTRDSAALTISTRHFKNLAIKAKYEHQETDAPAYNSGLEASDKGSLSLTWTPVPRLFTYLSVYGLTGHRDSTLYMVNGSQVAAGPRDVNTGKAIGMVGLNLRSDITLTTSYAYIENSIKQQVLYDNFGTNPATLADDSSYKEKAYSIAATLNYRPVRKLDIEAGVTYTKSRSDFSPTLGSALAPVSIGSYSETEQRDTEYSITGGYRIGGGWRAALQYRYKQFADLLENPNNPEAFDGKAQVMLLTLSKKWL